MTPGVGIMPLSPPPKEHVVRWHPTVQPGVTGEGGIVKTVGSGVLLLHEDCAVVYSLHSCLQSVAGMVQFGGGCV